MRAGKTPHFAVISPFFSIIKEGTSKIKPDPLKAIAAVLFCWASVCTSGQTVRDPISVPNVGLGAYSNNHIDVFSIHGNKAALAEIKTIAGGIYGEKRFLLNELGLYNVAVALPTSSGDFAIDAAYYGFSEYNESQLGLAYARKLGRKVDMGVQFNYYNVRLAGYGSASAVTFELGGILHLTDNLNAGFEVYNPVGGSLGKNAEEKLPSVYSLGLGYDASEKFFMSIEIDKEEDKPINVRAGFEYKFLPQLLTRIGISTATSSFYFGIGFGLKTIRLDVMTSYHPQLGITPGLSLIFNGRSTKQNI